MRRVGLIGASTGDIYLILFLRNCQLIPNIADRLQQYDWHSHEEKAPRNENKSANCDAHIGAKKKKKKTKFVGA